MQDETGLFVYGTLLSGEENAGWLGGLPAREARVKGRLYRLPAGYPALVVEGEALNWVEGEWISGVGPRLKVLDQLEGVGQGLFARVRLPVVVGARTLGSWVYVLKPDQVRERGGLHLAEGSWRRVSGQRKQG
jgi:gamma-glutamylcyclotransferase (GGCT)/AIG2-like uncharacterized protein YtfP